MNINVLLNFSFYFQNMRQQYSSILESECTDLGLFILSFILSGPPHFINIRWRQIADSSDAAAAVRTQRGCLSLELSLIISHTANVSVCQMLSDSAAN